MIIDSTGLSLLENVDDVIRVSGSLENHYSPQAKVILNTGATNGQGFIALAEYQLLKAQSGWQRLAILMNMRALFILRFELVIAMNY